MKKGYEWLKKKDISKRSFASSQKKLTSTTNRDFNRVSCSTRDSSRNKRSYYKEKITSNQIVEQNFDEGCVYIKSNISIEQNIKKPINRNSKQYASVMDKISEGNHLKVPDYNLDDIEYISLDESAGLRHTKNRKTTNFKIK